ncbi:MAG: 5-formyltetrahydrofolate cyclo-ligase [Phycisphaerae bacterium]|jgi:5-formyltetrahydrofolate cyclo-ligase
MDKGQLRRHFRKMLLDMDPQQRVEKSKRVCRNLIQTPQFANAGTIMVYLAMPIEVDTAEIILYAWQAGKTVAAPKISWQQRHMIPVEIKTLDTGFATEFGGLRNPTRGAPTPFAEIDLVITPGLGFDHSGNRLGRGGSYYDRFFTSNKLNAVKCGLAFAEQVVDEITTNETDVPLDMLVTDETVIYFNSDDKPGCVGKAVQRSTD